MRQFCVAFWALLIWAPVILAAQTTDDGTTAQSPQESEPAIAPANPGPDKAPNLGAPITPRPTEGTLGVSAHTSSPLLDFLPRWRPDDAPGYAAPRLTVRHDIGDGPGFRNGFTYLEGFIPLWQMRSDRVLFSNFRAVNFDHSELWEFNAGLGARKYLPSWDRILGGHVHYDGRTTLNGNYFNQVTFGVESLGAHVDYRANCYLPVGPQHQQIAEGVGNARFAGFNILLDRTQVSEVALRGFDAEIGTPIPPFCKWDARAFIGYYHYSNSGLESVNGIRGRIEANLCDAVTLHLSVQSDAVFDTTVYGGVAFHFGPGRHTRSGIGRGVIHRMGDRVVRDPNIVVNNQVNVTAELARDVNTGDPLVIRHANSAAAAGGDGTIERPFQTLAQLQTGSAAKDILFLHANSTFTQPALTLKNGQRLLGEGVDHRFTTTEGAFLLPRATTGANAPLLLRTGAGTNAVTLAADNEVSGLRYQRTGGAGGFISGTGNLGTFNINRNSTTGGLAAVALTNATGSGVVSANSFGAHTLNAIGVVQTSNSLRLLIEDNQFKGGTAGITMTQTGGTQFLGIRDNVFTSAVSVTDTVIGGTQTLQMSNNVGTGGYILTRISGTFRAENLLGTNTPTPTTIGTITLVPAGSAGFP